MAQITRPALEKLIDDLAKTTARPAFLDLIRTIRDAPEDKQFETARNVAKLDVVYELGIPVPKGVRITTRVFEDPEDARTADVQPLGHVEPMVTFADGVGTVAHNGIVTVVESKVADDLPIAPSAERKIEERTPEFIQSVIATAIGEIGDFVLTTEFQSLVEELYSLPIEERAQFVFDVVLSPEQWAQRGIVVPEDMLIQRSTFHDGRPTMFCVSKVVPLASPWHKVTVTFDSE